MDNAEIFLDEYDSLPPEDRPEVKPEQTSCPGTLGTDYGMYLNCYECPMQKNCQAKHDRKARELREQLHGVFFIRLTILLTAEEKLTPLEAMLLSIIIYRTREGQECCTEINHHFTQYLNCSKSQVSKLLNDEYSRSLIVRGYIEKRTFKYRKHGEWHDQRRLFLTKKTIVILNKLRVSNLQSGEADLGLPLQHHNPNSIEEEMQ